MSEELGRAPNRGDVVPLGPIALVAHRMSDGRVSSVGLRLAEEDEEVTLTARLKKAALKLWAALG